MGVRCSLDEAEMQFSCWMEVRCKSVDMEGGEMRHGGGETSILVP